MKEGKEEKYLGGGVIIKGISIFVIWFNKKELKGYYLYFLVWFVNKRCKEIIFL